MFLDTLVRFEEGSDENEAAQNRELANAIFALLTAGARTVWPLHHSTKSFADSTEMKIGKAVRGSGDLTAMLSNCLCLRQIEKTTNTIFVQELKGRDHDEMPKPFLIQGRPYIDQTGDFKLIKAPGECEDLGVEISHLRSEAKEKRAFAKSLWAQQVGRNEVARQVRGKFGTCSQNTVTKWFEMWEKNPNAE